MVVPILFRSRRTHVISTDTIVQWSRVASRVNVYRVRGACAFNARFNSREGSR